MMSSNPNKLFQLFKQIILIPIIGSALSPAIVYGTSEIKLSRNSGPYKQVIETGLKIFLDNMKPVSGASRVYSLQNSSPIRKINIRINPKTTLREVRRQPVREQLQQFRFQQHHQGIPVWGKQIRTTMRDAG